MAYTDFINTQVAPLASTLTTLYTVPALKSIVFSVTATNRSGKPTRVELAIIKNGDPIENKHYLVYQIEINGYQKLVLCLNAIANQNDVIQVLTNDESVSFNLFGELKA